MPRDAIPQKPTQAERSAVRKARILREAQQLFGQYGFRGAKLSDIAEAAGLTEPGLLHHFPSKAHLLMGLLEERDCNNRHRFEESIDTDLTQLLSSLESLVAYNQTLPEIVQLFTTLVAESIDLNHPAHAYFVDRYRTLRSQFSDRLQKAQEAGVIRQDIPAETLVVMIFALMDGLQIQWLLDPDQVNMDQVFSAFIQIIHPPS